MSDSKQRSHAAHSYKGTGADQRVPSEELPSYLLHPESDEMREMLEELDDAIFTAIQGSEQALREALELWPTAIAKIDPELVEESREQYLRYAIEVSRRYQQSETRSPESSIAALEIITLLTNC